MCYNICGYYSVSRSYYNTSVSACRGQRYFTAEGGNGMSRYSGRRRRRFPWGILLCMAALTAFFLWSNRTLQTEEFDFRSARLPAAFDGFRIVHLSDLHGAEFGENNAALLERVAAAEPDIIAVTGDLIDEETEDPQAYAAALAPQLQAIAPVYYVTGNHEWATGGVPALKETLTAAGWTVLSNRYLPLERNGETVIVAGIDDPNGYADQKTPETLTAELYAAHGDPFWILLAHRNDHFAGQYSLLGADLTLSGHGHGGIIRLPFTDGLLGTQHNFFPTHTAGLYEENGSALFVSRGIGNVGITFRLFNRPEVAVLTLYKG